MVHVKVLLLMNLKLGDLFMVQVKIDLCVLKNNSTYRNIIFLAD